MGELRQDRITGEWSIIAPERSKRPHRPEDSSASTAHGANKSREGVAARDPACPFCPGDEYMLEPIIEETPGSEAPGWQNRAVLNKYPILSSTHGEQGAGYGNHEVIIETPRHDLELADFSPAEMAALVEMWHRRYRAALALPGIRSVQLFRNCGSAAGASLKHAHSQVVALPIAPPRHEATLSRARTYHAETGNCLICAELARELDEGPRVVELTDDFALLVPYAAQSPLEQWIVPRRHSPCFSVADAPLRGALGMSLLSAVRRLASVAGDCAYNLVLEPGSSLAGDSAAAHWSMRLVPATVTPGGFELGSGIAANPSSPEDDALRLCEAPACTSVYG